MTARTAQRLALAAVALAVGYYYLWQARAATGPFAWRGDKNGFYGLLARGFLSGHLYVPIQPKPELLALPNPWDPRVEDSLKWQDMVLYNGRYYLYFGAAPAVLLFVPWRAITGNDLPENFAACILLYGGFLFLSGAVLRVLGLACARPPVWLVPFLFLALGVCHSGPFLLNRAAVYEIAIASGFFFVAGGLFFLARGVGPGARPWNLAASGVMFGLAVASRPHLVLAGALALAGLTVYSLRRSSRAFMAFAVAWTAIGAGIALYNYQRFGNPLEFGFRYQLAGPGQNRVDIAARNLVPGVYYMLLARPEFGPVFPWMRMVYRHHPFDSAERFPLPPDYFLEPTVGALWLAPLILAALAGVRGAKHVAETRLIVRTAMAGGLAALLFLITTHLMTQRYEVDFLPLLVFSAVAALALSSRKAVGVAACVLIGYSTLANLAIALAGPYDEHLRNRPVSYLRLDRRFALSTEHRRLVSPRISVRLEAKFSPDEYREPIVTVGQSHYCYFLYVEWTGAGLRIVSKTNESQIVYEMAHPKDATTTIALKYAPEIGEMRVEIDGREAIVHPVGMLIAAASQVTIGENLAEMGLTARRFTGALRVIEKTVEERR
jgi:hypothetical protein